MSSECPQTVRTRKNKIKDKTIIVFGKIWDPEQKTVDRQLPGKPFSIFKATKAVNPTAQPADPGSPVKSMGK